MKNLSSSFKLLVNFLILSVCGTLLLKAVFLIKLLTPKSTIMESADIVSNNWSLILTTLTILLLSYIFWLLLKFRKTIYSVKTESFFSKENSTIFQTVGKGLIYYSIGIFVIRVLEYSFEKVSVAGESVAYTLGKNIGSALGDRIPLLIIAFFILIIAKLIKDGYQLKKENDLTI